jgi:phage terminase large subunit
MIKRPEINSARLLASPYGFVRGVLRIPTYPWLDAIYHDLDRPGAVAVKACNGGGKTTKLAVPAALWHSSVFPGSLTVVTAGVFRQVKEQFFPELRSYAKLFPGAEFLDASVTFANGSRILGFSTDEPGNFEGFHNDHLLVIVDEAKSVPDAIFEAIERCQPERTLLLSSPGSPRGTFYRAFTRDRRHYKQHTVTAHDCPHLSREWIEQQIEKHGIESPLVRSMIFAEFIEEDSLYAPLSVAQLERCLQNPPDYQPGPTRAFCDFAAGGDENVLAVVRGNRVEIVAAWQDADTMRAVGRFIQLFREHAIGPSEISCDGGGLGIPMCDRLKENGWPVRRINNGSPAKDTASYANLGAEVWMTGVRKIERCEVILPDNPQLFAQLTTRQAFPNSRGQIMLESKEQMRARGLPSPDRADAVLGSLYKRASKFLYA